MSSVPLHLLMQPGILLLPRCSMVHASRDLPVPSGRCHHVRSPPSRWAWESCREGSAILRMGFTVTPLIRVWERWAPSPDLCGISYVALGKSFSWGISRDISHGLAVKHCVRGLQGPPQHSNVGHQGILTLEIIYIHIKLDVNLIPTKRLTQALLMLSQKWAWMFFPSWSEAAPADISILQSRGYHLKTADGGRSWGGRKCWTSPLDNSPCMHWERRLCVKLALLL